MGGRGAEFGTNGSRESHVTSPSTLGSTTENGARTANWWKSFSAAPPQDPDSPETRMLPEEQPWETGAGGGAGILGGGTLSVGAPGPLSRPLTACFSPSARFSTPLSIRAPTLSGTVSRSAVAVWARSPANSSTTPPFSPAPAGASTTSSFATASLDIMLLSARREAFDTVPGSASGEASGAGPVSGAGGSTATFSGGAGGAGSIALLSTG